MTISVKPSTIPIVGERTMKASVLNQPSGLRTSVMPPEPKCHAYEVSAEPAYAPTRACELDVGRPKYHVIRFHAIAPSTPASNTYNWSLAGIFVISIMSPPTVFATAVPNPTTAMKLKNPAQRTATAGESTRVATTVAIEFAAT